MEDINKFEKPALDEYYMTIAFMISSRANCLNKRVGAVLVTPDNKHILATSYNGVPTGLPHCEDICTRRAHGFKSGEGLSMCRAAHAEQNILTQLARNNAGSSKDAIMYITHSPCNECTKLIINSGIKKIVYCEEYPNPQAFDNLKTCGIEVIQMDKDAILNKMKSFIDLI